MRKEGGWNGGQREGRAKGGREKEKGEKEEGDGHCTLSKCVC